MSCPAAVVVLFLFGFVGWAAVAPLESAIVAPGTVIVETHRKQIQHLEGEIVKEILVQDGQMVKRDSCLSGWTAPRPLRRFAIFATKKSC